MLATWHVHSIYVTHLGNGGGREDRLPIPGVVGRSAGRRVSAARRERGEEVVVGLGFGGRRRRVGGRGGGVGRDVRGALGRGVAVHGLRG